MCLLSLPNRLRVGLDRTTEADARPSRAFVARAAHSQHNAAADEHFDRGVLSPSLQWCLCFVGRRDVSADSDDDVHS